MSVEIDGTNGITSPGLEVDTDTLYVDEVNNRVGVGTSLPNEPLHVNGNAQVDGVLATNGGASDAPAHTFSIDPDSGMFRAGINEIGFCTNGVESVRLDGNQVVLVGETAAHGNALMCVAVPNATNGAFSTLTASTLTRNHWRIRNGNGLVGAVSTSGSSTNYATSSDYRLKENLVPITGALARVAQIPVYRFNFIADPDKTVDGFVAHELAPHIPEAVTGEKDAVDAEGNPVYQGVDQSKPVPLLTAAVQELLEEVNALKARIEALEQA